jgi:[NiFe] hydrogenase diaphorase moiety small subunit
VTDRAAQVCPTGAILRKRHGFAVPIGERLYDHADHRRGEQVRSP